MQPHYYLMKNKKILRLEAEMSFESLPLCVRERVFEESFEAMDQNQANWRVVIFRDEIMDYEEYTEWLAGPEALIPEEDELELLAN